MKVLVGTIIVFAALYVLVCVLLYFNQESLIFFPDKLPKNFRFGFQQPFEEVSIKTPDSNQLNALLFKADSSKGVILYLHGNAGALNTWGEVAKTYTDLHYDVLMLDYRGYGKSTGKIENEQQFFSDLQQAYNFLKEQYPENQIIVLGYSIGTGGASYLAVNNHPHMLILQAPYFSLVDMMKRHYSFIPTFILKYKFETDKYLPMCKMPIVMFHGDADEVIDYQSSLKLKPLLKQGDTLITLHGQGHNNITFNPDYQDAISRLLRKISLHHVVKSRESQ